MAKIRFFKIISSILLCAIFALGYVHQEIEIVKTGFNINKHRHEVSFLLDQYRSLVYNLSQLESPRRIEDTLCVNKIALCVPEADNIRRFDRVDLAYRNENVESAEREFFLVRFFDRFSAKAEAKVVE
ncbi:MAG: hypothetical protein ISS90_00495 [Candidatus Omnitrophica bacterium]|nr:hypothetical protein [Candidatus Omnitrophota bacterium]